MKLRLMLERHIEGTNDLRDSITVQFHSLNLDNPCQKNSVNLKME